MAGSASEREGRLKAFDWHSDPITRKTPITATYRNTQNVRRFFKAECGDHFKFDRAFMAWLKSAKEKTMGDAVKEWLRREGR
jgi:hypothetical protein